MAAKIPAHVLIASFRFETAAGDALTRLKNAAKTQGLGIHNAAVLKVSDEGKLSIKETADMTGRKARSSAEWLGVSSGYWAVRSFAARDRRRCRRAGREAPRLRILEPEARGHRLSCTAGRLAAHRRCGRESGRAAVAILKHYGAEVVQEAIDGKVAEELEAAEPAEAPAGATPAELHSSG